MIVYFKDVVKAFKARFKQLGGKIVAQESYQSLGGNNVQNAVTRLNGKKADVIVTATAAVRRAPRDDRPGCARSATRRRS